MNQSVSLRSRLLRTAMLSSIVAGLLAFLLLLAISIYHNMQVHDEIMEEMADSLLLTDIVVHSHTGQLDELSEEFDIQYLLQDDQRILSHSSHFQALYFDQLPAGFSVVWRDHQFWRSYTKKEQGELRVAMLQPFSIRLEDVLQTLGVYLASLLLLWLVQWGLLRGGVSKQLKPLRQLSQQIAEKSPHELDSVLMPDPVVEIQPVVEALNQLLTRLQRALNAEQRFTADASHELRSPLSAIQLRLQLLQRKYADLPELQQDLVQIQQDVYRGTQVLENLLLLARLEPEQQAGLPQQLLEVTAVMDEVVCSLQPFIQQKQILLQRDDAEANVAVHANHDLLFISLRNLLDNAIRYVDPGGTVWIHMKRVKQGLYIGIEDNGPGVNDEVLAQLGQRFFRVLGTKTTGSGLGLSIVQKIVALHGGQMHLAHSVHGGLKVELLFPVPEN